MSLNLQPVGVEIVIETPSLNREAFYNMCFITENDEAPRTLKVEKLQDLLDNGYNRSSLAYNFCVGVFAQRSMPFVYIRAKRSSETYEVAFSADDNSDYYYVVIESKELHEILEFNDYLSNVDDYKLQFYSNNSQELFELQNSNLVNYYQEVFDFSVEEDYYIDKAYKKVYQHNFSSKPYPALVEKQDAYTATISPLDITLREVLKERFFDDDAYTTSIKPLDITVRNVLRRKDISNEDVYIPTIKPLDITLRNILLRKDVDDYDTYITSIRPLDMTLKRVLVSQNVNDFDAYTPTIKPLDITLRKGV